MPNHLYLICSYLERMQIGMSGNEALNKEEKFPRLLFCECMLTIPCCMLCVCGKVSNKTGGREGAKITLMSAVP